MKNIHVLPSRNPSGIHFYDYHITSDEEIKFDDYITDGYLVWKWKDNSSLLGRKKVILSTDQGLIKDGVQAIDDEFLEWFVKNPSCEEVEVVKEDWMLNPDVDFFYKIIIPKEEPKQETLEEAFKRIRRELDYAEFDFSSFRLGVK